MIALFIVMATEAVAQSPYAMFGDNSEMLEAENESGSSIYRIEINAQNGSTLYADFDLKIGIVTLSDLVGNIRVYIN